MRFHATLQLHGKTATGIEVPAEVVQALGSGRKPAVVVTLAGHTYRSTVAARGELFLLPVSADVRSAAGVAAGDDFDVDLVLDTAPRELVLPDDFAAALDGEPAARAFFDGLSFSKRRRFADPIAAAKTDETRRRRIATAIDDLRAGRA